MKILNIGIFGLLLIILVLIIVFIICNVFDKIYTNNAIKSNFSNSKNDVKRDKKYYGGGVNIFEDIDDNAQKLFDSTDVKDGILNIKDILPYCLKNDINPSLQRELTASSEENYVYHIFNYSTICDLIEEIEKDTSGKTYDELFFDYSEYNIDFSKLKILSDDIKTKIKFLITTKGENILGNIYFGDDPTKIKPYTIKYTTNLLQENLQKIILFYNDKYKKNKIIGIKNIFNLFSNNYSKFNILYQIYDFIKKDSDIDLSLKGGILPTDQSIIDKVMPVIESEIKKEYEKINGIESLPQVVKDEIINRSLTSICHLFRIPPNFENMKIIPGGTSVGSTYTRLTDKSPLAEFEAEYKKYLDYIDLLNELKDNTINTFSDSSKVTKINQILEKMNIIIDFTSNNPDSSDKLDEINKYRTITSELNEIIKNYKEFKKMNLGDQRTKLDKMLKSKEKPKNNIEFLELTETFNKIKKYFDIKKKARGSINTKTQIIYYSKDTDQKTGNIAELDIKYIYMFMNNLIKTAIINHDNTTTKKWNNIDNIISIITSINNRIIEIDKLLISYTDFLTKNHTLKQDTDTEDNIIIFNDLKQQWIDNTFDGDTFKSYFNDIYNILKPLLEKCLAKITIFNSHESIINNIISKSKAQYTNKLIEAIISHIDTKQKKQILQNKIDVSTFDKGYTDTINVINKLIDKIDIIEDIQKDITSRDTDMAKKIVDKNIYKIEIDKNVNPIYSAKITDMNTNISNMDNFKSEYDKYIKLYNKYINEWKKLDNKSNIDNIVNPFSGKKLDINKIKTQLDDNLSKFNNNFINLDRLYKEYEIDIKPVGLPTADKIKEKTRYYSQLYKYLVSKIEINNFKDATTNQNFYLSQFKKIQEKDTITKKKNDNNSYEKKVANLKKLIEEYQTAYSSADQIVDITTVAFGGSKHIVHGGTELITKYITAYTSPANIKSLHYYIRSITNGLKNDYRNLEEFFTKFIILLRESNPSLIPEKWEWEDKKNKKQPVEWSNIPFFKQKTWSDPIKETQASTIYWRIKDSVGKKEIVIIERDDSIYKKDKNKIYYKPLTPDEKKMLKKRIYSENRDLIDETYEIDEIIDGINSVNPVSGRYYIYQNGAWTNYLLPME